MAKEVTIIKFDEKTSNALVLFEDEALGFSSRIGIYIPDDLVDADDVLNFCAARWPEREYADHQKPSGQRQGELKKLLNSKRDITDRVDNPRGNPRDPRSVR